LHASAWNPRAASLPRSYVITGTEQRLPTQKSRNNGETARNELARRAWLASTIQWVGGDNPGREGSPRFARYAQLIRAHGRTVRQFLRGGGAEATLRNSIRLKLTKLKP